MSEQNSKNDELSKEEKMEKIKEQVNATDFPIDEELTFEQKYTLLNYHVKELEAPFKEIYDTMDADYQLNHKLAVTTAMTLRTVGYPVTIEEVAYDFDVTDNNLRKGIKKIREVNDIDEELEKTYKKEKRMILVQNLDYSVDFKQAFNTLIDDLYIEYLEENNDEYSWDTVLLTCAWMASKLTSFDTDTIYINQLNGFFDSVTSMDIRNCYLNLFVDDGHQINPKVADSHAILEQIDRASEEYDWLTNKRVQETITFADSFLEIYDKEVSTYDNRTVAMIVLRHCFDLQPHEVDYQTSTSKIDGIEKKMKEDYGEDLNIF